MAKWIKGKYDYVNLNHVSQISIEVINKTTTSGSELIYQVRGFIQNKTVPVTLAQFHDSDKAIEWIERILNAN